jgi:hypothetical protein
VTGELVAIIIVGVYVLGWVVAICLEGRARKRRKPSGTIF